MSLFLFCFVFTLPIENQDLEDGGLALIARSNDFGDLQYVDDFIKRSEEFVDFQILQDLLTQIEDEEKINELVERFDDYEPTGDLTKREVALLTFFMTQLNVTGLGVGFVRNFATSPLSQGITINGVVGFLKSRNVASLLTSLDTSNLGVNVVNQVLSNTKAFGGLITIAKALVNQGVISFGKREELQILKRDFFSDFFGGLFGGRPATTTSTPAIRTTTPSSAGQPVSATTSGSSRATASSAGSVAGQPTLSATNGVSTTAKPSATSTTQSAAQGGLGGFFDSIFGGLFGQPKTSSTPATATPTSGSVLPSGSKNDTSLLGLDSAAKVPALANSGLDQSQIAIFAKFLGFASNANVEDFMVSLSKSGLGASVIQDALINPSMQNFVQKLALSIKNNNVWTFDQVWNAILSTNFLTNTFTKISNSTQYLNTVLNFVKYFLANFGSFL